MSSHPLESFNPELIEGLPHKGHRRIGAHSHTPIPELCHLIRNAAIGEIQPNPPP